MQREEIVDDKEVRLIVKDTDDQTPTLNHKPFLMIAMCVTGLVLVPALFFLFYYTIYKKA
jgi:hypothetical protein